MDLSFVVVSYNVRELLANCLRSVRETLRDSGIAYEVWVIDNASSDDSASMVRRDLPEMHLIANAENSGFAAANNQGIRQAGGRYVFLLNPDTELLDGAAQEMMGFMERTPGAGMVGPSLSYGDGSFQHSAFRFPSLAQIFLDFFPLNHRLTNSRINGRFPVRLYQRNQPFLIDHPLGAAMLLRRQAIDQVGMLDERYFMYCEEIDWAIRIKRGGWTIHTVPRARITHHAGQSTRQFRDRMFIALWRSRFRLFAQHYSPAFQWAARQIVGLGLWREERRLAALSDEAERRSRRLAYQAVRELPSELREELSRT